MQNRSRLRHAVRYVVVALALAVIAATTGTVAAQAPDAEIAVDVDLDVRTSCLGGDGRLDVFADGLADPAGGQFRIRVVNLGRPEHPRDFTFAPTARGELGLRSITGRTEGAHLVQVQLRRSGAMATVVAETRIDVRCDGDTPQVSEPEVVLRTSCAFDAKPGASGEAYVHIINPTNLPAVYLASFSGRANTSTTIAPRASAIRRTAELSDGEHRVRVSRNGEDVFAEDFVIDCDPEDGPAIGSASIVPVGGDPTTQFGGIEVAPNGDTLLLMASLGFRTRNVQLIRCSDAACRGDREHRFVISGQNSAAEDPIALAITDDGHPVIAFMDGPLYNSEGEYSTFGPAIMICADPLCDRSVTRRWLPEPRFFYDTASYVSGTSLALDSSGTPHMSYYGSPSEFPYNEWSVYLASCGDPTCEEITTREFPHLERAKSRQGSTQLIVDGDDSPVIVTRSELVACSDPACSRWKTTSFPDAVISDVARAPDGAPVLTVRPSAEDAVLRLVHCADSACTIQRTATLNEIPAGLFGSVAVSPAGTITIVSRSGLVHCSDTTCARTTTASLDNVPFGAAFALGPEGQPVFAAPRRVPDYESVIDLVSCADAACQQPSR